MVDEAAERERAIWLAYAYGYGMGRLYVMHDELERGADLTIDPVAWENTMAALVWMAGQWSARSTRYDHPITDQHCEMLRRVAALGREALAGGPRSPELVPLIEKCLVTFYGPDWAIPDWPSTLERLTRTATSPQKASAAPDRGAEDDDLDFGFWLVASVTAGIERIEQMVQALERGAPDLGIDPAAWENCLAALTWAVELSLGSDRVGGLPTTEEDLHRVRRVRALGSEALSGNAPSPELLPFARACLQVLAHGPSMRP